MFAIKKTPSLAEREAIASREAGEAEQAVKRAEAALLELRTAHAVALNKVLSLRHQRQDEQRQVGEVEAAAKRAARIEAAKAEAAKPFDHFLESLVRDRDKAKADGNLPASAAVKQRIEEVKLRREKALAVFDHCK